MIIIVNNKTLLQ